MFEHDLGTQEARGDRDRCDILTTHLACHGEGQADHCRLYHVEEQISAISVRVPVSDLDDQARGALALCRVHHQRRGKMAGDYVCVDRVTEHGKTLLEVNRPKRLAELLQCTLRNVVDQDVELSLLFPD